MVGALTVLITIEVAVVCTYVQLCAEDYHWWYAFPTLTSHVQARGRASASWASVHVQAVIMHIVTQAGRLPAFSWQQGI